jgi:cadmium resistance protein CadD (predicted permease)
MSQYGRFLVTMLALDGLGYALVVLLVPSNSIAQLAGLVPVLLVAPLVARRIVYGEWVTRPETADDEGDENGESDGDEDG